MKTQLLPPKDPLARYFKPLGRPYRSINLLLDQDSPETFGRFIPTSKSVMVFDALRTALSRGRQDRALAIVAPYGSGKSTSLLLLKAFLEKRKNWEIALSEVQKRFSTFDHRFGERLAAWSRSTRPYVVVPISGDPGALAPAYREALLERLEALGIKAAGTKISHVKSVVGGLKDVLLPTLAALRPAIERAGYEGVCFVHDEFGRVLERSMQAAEGDDLFFLQTLAEAASRGDRPELALVLSLHQGFAQYAGSAPAHVRSEWAKVEGRFRQIAFIEDSEQVYELISQAIGGLRTAEFSVIQGLVKAMAADWATHGQKTAFFDKFSAKDRLNDIFAGAYPLHPAALFLLPRLSARLAQNERTLFHFLLGEDTGTLGEFLLRADPEPGLRASMRVVDLFPYFADLARRDTGVGGAYKRWVEMSAALSRTVAHGRLEQEIIKTVGLLSLIAHEAGLFLSENLIEFALGISSKEDQSEFRKALTNLTTNKVLLYRKLRDEYRLWEGADLDLQGLVRQRAAEWQSQFRLGQFLKENFRAPAVLAREHNDKFAIQRYFEGSYVAAEDLPNILKDTNRLPAGVDGRILYILADSKTAIEAARRELAKNNDQQIIALLPNRPLGLATAALEFRVLKDLLVDTEFLSQDPLLRKEVAQLADDALTHVRRRLVAISEPIEKQVTVWHAGKDIKHNSEPRALGRLVSAVCDESFNKTPMFRNEIINRNSPSVTIGNARRRLLRAMLEANGTPSFGLKGHGPDVSMFRAVLHKKGVYVSRTPENWGYAPWSSFEDAHLREAFVCIDKYIADSSDAPRGFKGLIEDLKRSPYGIREGVLPILFCAYFVGYATGATLLENGVYIKDFTPEIFDRLIATPESFQVQGTRFSEEIGKYVVGVRDLFALKSGRTASSKDMVRGSIEGIYSWFGRLPPLTMTSYALSLEARAFRKLLQEAKDPCRLLLNDVPSAFGVKLADVASAEKASSKRWEKVLGELSRVKAEMDDFPAATRKRAEGVLRREFSLAEKAQKDLRKHLRAWHGELNPGLVDLVGLDDLKLRGFISRIVEYKYDSDDLFIDSLAAQLVGRPLLHWDDSGIQLFERGLLEVLSQVRSLERLLERGKGGEVKGVLLSGFRAGKIEPEIFIERTNISKEGRELMLSIRATLNATSADISTEELKLIAYELLKSVANGRTPDSVEPK